LMVICYSSLLRPQAAPAANPTSNSADTKHSEGTERKILGSIAGRVFAVTEAGEIKSARFARVYLMRIGRNPDSPAQVFFDTLRQKLLDQPESYSEKLLCIKKLRNITYSVDVAAKWARENNKYSEFLGTQADEEGMFHFTKVETGGYVLIVQGRAGANEAYWKEDVFFFPRGGKPFWTVGSGNALPSKDVFLKLSSPETACLDE